MFHDFHMDIPLVRFNAGDRSHGRSRRYRHPAVPEGLALIAGGHSVV